MSADAPRVLVVDFGPGRYGDTFTPERIRQVVSGSTIVITTNATTNDTSSILIDYGTSPVIDAWFREAEWTAPQHTRWQEDVSPKYDEAKARRALKMERRGFHQMARLPCYRGARTR